MSNKLLKDAGEALYGPHWQSELARQLGVNDRTVRRWVSGATDTPPGISVDLLRLCTERAQEIDVVIDRLKREAAP